MKKQFYTLFIGLFILSCGTENNPTYTLTTTVSPHDLLKGKNLFRLDDVTTKTLEEELINRFNKLSEKKQKTILELVRGMEKD